MGNRIGIAVVVWVGVVVACTGEDPALNAPDGDGGVSSSSGNASSSGAASSSGTPVGGGSFALVAPPVTPSLVMPGETVKLALEIERRDGFAGAVKIDAQPLPDGVSAAPLTIPAGATKGELSLTASASALQTKGKVQIVATSDPSLSDTKEVTVIVRGKPGARDTTFGTSGLAAIGEGKVRWTALGQNDSVVVLVEENDANVLLVRLLADGSRDMSFGNAGVVKIPANPSAVYHTMHVATDDTITVVAHDSNTANATALIHRFGTNGAYITTFGGGDAGTPGVARVDLGTTGVTSFAAVDSMGRVWLSAGNTFLRRVLANGSADTAFNAEGRKPVTSTGSWYGFVVRGDFVPVLVGATTDGRTKTSLVTSATSAVVSHLQIYDANPVVLSAAVDSQNRVLHSGRAATGGTPTNQHAFVLRTFASNGGGDTTFTAAAETFGTVSDKTSFGSLFVEPVTNKVLAVGQHLDSGTTSKAAILARYSEDGVKDVSFGTGGLVDDTTAPGTRHLSGVLTTALPTVVVIRQAADGSSIVTRYWR